MEYQMFDQDIRGLTLLRPWPWTFIHSPIPKRVENRSWAAPKHINWIALHSGNGWDVDGARFIQNIIGFSNPLPNKSRHSSGMVFAICRLESCIRLDQAPTHFQFKQGQDHWAFGPYCWVLKDFVELKNPMKCKGALGLWKIAERPGMIGHLQRAYLESLPSGASITGGAFRGVSFKEGHYYSVPAAGEIDTKASHSNEYEITGMR
jgi:hypothetical protein